MDVSTLPPYRGGPDPGPHGADPFEPARRRAAAVLVASAVVLVTIGALVAALVWLRMHLPFPQLA